MKIGIAGPMTLKLLDFNFKNENNIPICYDSPMISMLVNSLVKQGHKVVAYTTSTGIEHPIVYKGNNITICIARRKPHAARDLFKSERKDLIELMKDYPADIINAQWSYEFAWAAIDSGIPTLVTLRDNALTVLKYKFDSFRFMRLIINYIVLNKAQYLSTNSNYLFQVLSQKDKNKAHIIPNFYSKDFIQNSYKPFGEKQNYIISVSNGFSKSKNIATGLKAFAKIKKKMPNLEYHLVGDGMKIEGPAYKYSKKHKLSEGVKFIGKISYQEVLNMVKKALVFLHPSREESFGNSVLEAMALGTPVIGGNRSGNIPYLLDNGNAGILCDINNPEDIAKAILKLLSNNELLESLSINAKNFSDNNFSEDIVVPKYIDYYERLLLSNILKNKK